MPLIKLETILEAPIEKCFDISRSIDMHIESMEHTNEKAIAGTTSGLIGLGETVTWKARHFGIAFKMTIQITAMTFPESFTDEMVRGPFKMLRHHHLFEQKDDHTLMTDLFYFDSPLGIAGKLANVLFLNRYMSRLLAQRNLTLKMAVEKG